MTKLWKKWCHIKQISESHEFSHFLWWDFKIFLIFSREKLTFTLKMTSNVHISKTTFLTTFYHIKKKFDHINVPRLVAAYFWGYHCLFVICLSGRRVASCSTRTSAITSIPFNAAAAQLGDGGCTTPGPDFICKFLTRKVKPCRGAVGGFAVIAVTWKPKMVLRA